jgi:hypothetical protein
LSGKSFVWTDPELAKFVRLTAPTTGWQSKALHRAVIGKFGEAKGRSLGAFLAYARALHDGGGWSVPVADVPDVNELVLTLPWKTALVTGDYQIPYHDEELVKFAFDLGVAWGVEGHVFNADVFDMATMSKFPQQIYGERIQLGEELKIGRDIIKESKRLHRNVAFNTGNHEWRLFTKLLHGELDTDQVREILVGEGVQYTPLSYLWLGYKDEPVRVTHPRSQSVIVGTVGADIARNHDCHVIVAHDHVLAQRRSHSGRWTVVHAGMMASPGKLMYAVTADDRRPRMNQGFVIVHPDSETGKPRLHLIDPKNCDREREFWLAKYKGGKRGLDSKGKVSSSRRK